MNLGETIYRLRTERNMSQGDLAEALEIEIEEEDFDTLNGLMISELDHIPEENERATVYSHGLQMDILEVKNKMITLARVTKLPEEETEEESEEN